MAGGCGKVSKYNSEYIKSIPQQKQRLLRDIAVIE